MTGEAFTWLFDVGNSRLKWNACRHGDTKLLCETAATATATEGLASRLQVLRDLPQPVERILISNVAGESVAAELQAILSAYCQGPLEFIRVEPQRAGLRLDRYPRGQLGVDRWIAMLGAWAAYGERLLCVADCGTAVTLDFIEANGRHLGGLISAGAGLIEQSLTRNTAMRVPAEDSEQEVSACANTTQQAVKSGAAYAVAGIIRASVEDVQAKTQQSPQVIVTGGEAPAILPLLPQGTRHEPDLLLKGLAILAMS